MTNSRSAPPAGSVAVSGTPGRYTDIAECHTTRATTLRYDWVTQGVRLLPTGDFRPNVHGVTATCSPI